MKGFITIKEVSEKWGITERRIRVLCEQGRIHGASKIGPMWVIPVKTKKPEDKRIKNGMYIKK
nr:DNA-binding protein [uncultured Butyrivibrio sp.]